MTTDAPPPLAPPLRFPEFRDAGEWEQDQIGSIASISKGRGVSKADIAKGGLTPCIRYAELYTLYGEVIHEVLSHTNVPLEDLVLSQAEDVVVPASGETRADIARATCVVSAGVALGSDLNILRSDLNGRFFSYLINSPLRHKIARLAQGDTVAHLYPGQVSKVTITYPSLPEQQKIADCLGSLDGLIAAEGRKLETLRRHKKGLLQNLFPQPGETAPRLRFPEFKDAGEWEVPQLADLYDFKRTNTLSRDKLNYENGTIRNIHYGDIHTKFKPLFRVGNEYVPYVNPDASENGFGDDAFCEEGDIVLADASEDLNDVGKAIEIVSLDGERVVAGTHTILATRRRGVPVVGFGGQLFQSAAVRAGIKKEAQGAKVYGISANRISTVPVPVPPTKAEQQKIADCLGSLDGMLATQSQKVEDLKAHKKGLMQQLFPSVKG